MENKPKIENGAIVYIWDYTKDRAIKCKIIRFWEDCEVCNLEECETGYHRLNYNYFEIYDLEYIYNFYKNALDTDIYLTEKHLNETKESLKALEKFYKNEKKTI